MTRKAGPDFETSLKALEALVERMERGDLSLEDSLQQFERGVALIKTCQQALTAAEQKVRILSGTGAQETLKDFSDPDEEPAEDDGD